MCCAETVKLLTEQNEASVKLISDQNKLIGEQGGHLLATNKLIADNQQLMLGMVAGMAEAQKKLFDQQLALLSHTEKLNPAPKENWSGTINHAVDSLTELIKVSLQVKLLGNSPDFLAANGIRHAVAEAPKSASLPPSQSGSSVLAAPVAPAAPPPPTAQIAPAASASPAAATLATAQAAPAAADTPSAATAPAATVPARYSRRWHRSLRVFRAPRLRRFL